MTYIYIYIGPYWINQLTRAEHLPLDVINVCYSLSGKPAEGWLITEAVNYTHDTLIIYEVYLSPNWTNQVNRSVNRPVNVNKVL